jgi:hypothetical protein
MQMSFKILKQIGKLLLLGMLTMSCSTFIPERSFVEEMNRDSDPFLRPGRDFSIVSGDTGEAYRSRSEIKKRTPGSERSRQQDQEIESIKQELRQKEAVIPEELLEQYSKDKKYLPTDSDKLYYLNLAVSERNNYIETKKQDMVEDLGKRQDFVQKHSIHGGDVYLGMPKAQVVQVWGRPTKIEIAGHPKHQNERWSFIEDGSVKQIYFENGKVQGWALDL